MNLGSTLLLGLAGFAAYKLVSRPPPDSARGRGGRPAQRERQAEAEAEAEATGEPQRTSEPQRVSGGVSPKVTEEICRQWKVGQHRAQWTSAHLAAATGAVALAHEDLDRPWESPGEAKQLAFDVTREALLSICGAMDVPGNLLELQDALQTGPFWFQELWDRVYPMAWASVTGVRDNH